MAKVDKPEEVWRRELTPEQYEVARKAGTERAFTGKYWDTKTPGTYHCVCCGEPLFDSTTKYDSGSGRGDPGRRQPDDASHRGTLRQLRRAPRSRVSRWSRPDRVALLHEFRRARPQGTGPGVTPTGRGPQ